MQEMDHLSLAGETKGLNRLDPDRCSLIAAEEVVNERNPLTRFLVSVVDDEFGFGGAELKPATFTPGIWSRRNRL
jgi:hypothetical protein